MNALGFTLFDTAIGRCGIAWNERGVVGVQLPEGRESATRGRLRARFPAAHDAPPPPAIGQAVGDITALLAGDARDLCGVPLDLAAVPPFDRRVYEVARTIAPGATLSYGEVAARLGAPGAARAVGQALGRNPFAIVVPCHRVLAASGKLGGFSADGGVATKRRLLAIEGAAAGGATPLFAGAAALDFDAQTAVAHVRAADPALARLVDAVGPFRLQVQATATLFGALAEAIVYQQLTGKAAATIFGRLCALFPRARAGLTAARVLAVPEQRLRAAGLSRAKVASLRDLARRAAAGELPTLTESRRMDDETIVERLVAVRGIGRWTAEMFLIFRLGRPDVLPVDDYGIRKGFRRAFRTRELPGSSVLEKRGVRWRLYRTVASWYLWRASERARD